MSAFSKLKSGTFDTAGTEVQLSSSEGEELFGIRCNDTPVVRDLLEEVLISLRGDRELLIVDETGRAKPRANTIEWTDRIKLPAQRSFFGPLSEFEKTKK